MFLNHFVHFTVIIGDYDENDDDYPHGYGTYGTEVKTKPTEDEEVEKLFKELPPDPVYIPCDQVVTLYSLQPNALEGINDKINVGTSRPFWLKKIPHSNLLLIVIEVLRPSKGTKLTTERKIIAYEKEFPCYKLNMSFYDRRRIEECFTEHKDVS